LIKLYINKENVLYLLNIKHFPCWYTVISTQVELRKREIVWKHGERIYSTKKYKERTDRGLANLRVAEIVSCILQSREIL
jgi:hypothetical protein